MSATSRTGPLDLLRRYFLQTGIFAVVLLASVPAARAEPISVKEFNEKLDGWKAIDKDPSLLTLEVEGRVKIYSKDRLTLENCKVMFRSKTEFPERTRKSLNVVVIGKVSRDRRTSEQTFQVSSIRIVPGELEQFFDKRRQLKQTAAADDWYAAPAAGPPSVESSMPTTNCSRMRTRRIGTASKLKGRRGARTTRKDCWNWPTRRKPIECCPWRTN